MLISFHLGNEKEEEKRGKNKIKEEKEKENKILRFQINPTCRSQFKRAPHRPHGYLLPFLFPFFLPFIFSLSLFFSLSCWLSNSNNSK